MNYQKNPRNQYYRKFYSCIYLYPRYHLFDLLQAGSLFKRVPYFFFGAVGLDEF